jgi:hypothetical protein
MMNPKRFRSRAASVLACTVPPAIIGAMWLWQTPDAGAAFWWSHALAFCLALGGAAILMREKRRENGPRREGGKG